MLEFIKVIGHLSYYVKTKDDDVYVGHVQKHRQGHWGYIGCDSVFLPEEILRTILDFVSQKNKNKDEE